MVPGRYGHECLQKEGSKNLTEEAVVLDPSESDTSEDEILPQVIAEAAWDVKALGLKVIDVRGLVSYADFLVVCSGQSDRHVAAIASGIEKTLRPEKIRPLGVEGKEGGRWILIDYGDVVVHIFHDSERDVYGLDSLWSDAPELELEAPPGLERPAYS